MMFELYTQGARRVIFFAREEALRYGSWHIESEHLLLGIFRENEKVASRLAGPMVSFADLRKEIEAVTTVGQPITDRIEVPLSADCKRILMLAMEEADSLGQKRIFLGHLLLAILRVEESTAARILRSHGTTILGLRENAIRDMGWAEATGSL